MQGLSITISVNVDKTIYKLSDIGECVQELTDLIPEHNHYEAEKVVDELWKHVESLIERNDNS